MSFHPDFRQDSKLYTANCSKNETDSEALRREILKEARVCIKSIKDIGVIIEYRDEIKLLQISYCYFA